MTFKIPASAILYFMTCNGYRYCLEHRLPKLKSRLFDRPSANGRYLSSTLIGPFEASHALTMRMKPDTCR